MKKLVTVLFLISFLTGTTIVGELLKLPFLYTHYTEHKFKSDETTFISYLWNHYVEESDTNKSDPDFSDDLKLPFKAIENIHFHFAPFILSDSKLKSFLKQVNIFFFEKSYPTLLAFNPIIWQPPKENVIFI